MLPEKMIATKRLRYRRKATCGAHVLNLNVTKRVSVFYAIPPTERYEQELFCPALEPSFEIHDSSCGSISNQASLDFLDRSHGFATNIRW